MTGHGGWPMTVRARPRRQPVLRRHLLPRPAAARAAGVPPGAGGDRTTPGATGPTTYAGWPRTCASTCSREVSGEPRRRRRGRARRGRRRGWARVRRRCTAGFGGAPKFPPSMVLEFLLRHARRTGDARRGRWLDATLRGDGARRHLRPARRRLRALLRRPRAGWCRTSRRCSTTTRSCSASTPAGARRWGSGWPRRRPTSCSRELRHRRGRLRLRARRRLRGRGGHVLRLDAGPAGRRARPGRRRLGGATLFEVTDARHLRARHLDPPAADATPTTPSGWADVRRAAARRPRRRGCGRPATTRSSPPGTGWRSRRWSTPARLLGREELRRRRGRGGRAAGRRCTCATDGSLLRVSRDGVAGRHRGRARGPRLRRARLPGARRRHRRRGLARPGAGAARRRARRTSGADDGGFYDTADRRRGAGRPAAGPVRQRQPVRALGDGARAASPYAALTGVGPPPRRRPRRRSAPCAALAEQAPRFAGWSLAAAEAMLDGPLEVAVVGPAGAGARRARAGGPPALPGSRSWWPTTAGDDGSRCWRARTWSTADPAAYVCRELVCERPVTTVAELTALLDAA